MEYRTPSDKENYITNEQHGLTVGNSNPPSQNPPPPAKIYYTAKEDKKEFYQIYQKINTFFSNENWKLSIIYNKIKKENCIMKEYSNNFINLINQFTDISFQEEKNLKYCKSKYIIKLIDYFCEENYPKFIFENFEKTLKELMREKKTFKIEEIKNLLIKLNEGIKHLNKNQINNIAISPDNIGIIKNKDNIYSIKLIDLFPYYEIRNKCYIQNIQLEVFNYLSPEILILREMTMKQIILIFILNQFCGILEY